jgi:hypothetical protein
VATICCTNVCLKGCLRAFSGEIARNFRVSFLFSQLFERRNFRAIWAQKNAIMQCNLGALRAQLWPRPSCGPVPNKVCFSYGEAGPQTTSGRARQRTTRIYRPACMQMSCLCGTITCHICVHHRRTEAAKSYYRQLPAGRDAFKRRGSTEQHARGTRPRWLDSAATCQAHSRPKLL